MSRNVSVPNAYWWKPNQSALWEKCSTPFSWLYNYWQSLLETEKFDGTEVCGFPLNPPSSCHGILDIATGSCINNRSRAPSKQNTYFIKHIFYKQDILKALFTTHIISRKLITVSTKNQLMKHQKLESMNTPRHQKRRFSIEVNHQKGQFFHWILLVNHQKLVSLKPPTHQNIAVFIEHQQQTDR